MLRVDAKIILNQQTTREIMKNPCKICNEWTPETGCKHFLPDSETILKAAGYRIYKPGIDTRQKKFILAKTGEGKSHRFESLAKAAHELLLASQEDNSDNTQKDGKET